MSKQIGTVKREELARILGLSDTMINRLNKDGMPKVSHGSYDLATCVQWYIQTWRDRAEGSHVGNLWDEKKKQVIAQTERTELENAKLRGELIPRDVVNKTLNDVAVIISTQLDGLGARTSGIVAEMNDPGLIQGVLFDEARSIRAAIARSISDYAAMPDNGEDNTATTKTIRRRVGRSKPDSTPRKPGARTIPK